MSKKTASYVIRNAGQYESALASCREPVRVTEYPGLQDAIRAVGNIACLNVSEMVYVEGGIAGEFYLYADQEDADRDDSGAHALAIIVTKAELSREIEDHGTFDPETMAPVNA